MLLVMLWEVNTQTELQEHNFAGAQFRWSQTLTNSGRGWGSSHLGHVQAGNVSNQSACVWTDLGQADISGLGSACVWRCCLTHGASATLMCQAAVPVNLALV